MKLALNAIEERTHAVIHAFLKDMRPGDPLPTLHAQSSLERDLAIGSLEKAELMHRLERKFAIQLPANTLSDLDLLSDIIQAIRDAKPKHSILTETTIEPLGSSSIDPTDVTTLTAALKAHADREPTRPHVYLQDDQGQMTTLTYQDIWENADKVAQGIVGLGIKPDETISIMLPTSAEFFYAFMGILLAGCVPVPIYPPVRANQLEEYVTRETHILNNANVRLLITIERAERLSKVLKSFIPSLLKVTTVEALQQDKQPLPEISTDASKAGLIQYTSGSTGYPKGVLLTHGNLLSNIRAFKASIELTPDDRVVSWLPLYHDMGLIGAWLGSLYYGLPLRLSSPLTFLARPSSWLWAIHYHRATLSVAPNFAYEMCLKKIDDTELKGLDLSCVRHLLNGSEAIYPATLRAFYKRFSRYGLREEAILPVYGLAESTVGLTVPPLNRPFQSDRVDYDILMEQQKAVKVDAKHKHAREYVSCGKPLPDHAIRVVDADQTPLAEREVGEVQFQGPSSMQGYYANPEATQAIYHDGWWGTGDLGYLAAGELYITGRKKDVIIKAGRNYSPIDIEELAGAIQGFRPGCVVAFGASDKATGTEKIVIVAEVYTKQKNQFEGLKRKLKQHITAQMGIPPDDIVLVPPQTVLKTSSGKLRRAAMKDLYLQGKLGQRKKPYWLQIVSLWTTGMRRNLSAYFYGFLKSFYGLYAISLLLISLLPMWLLIMLTPLPLRQRITKRWAQLYLCLMFCPVTVKGKKWRKKQKTPTIYVANHASYLDTLVLLATLKPGVVFVGKKELMHVPFLGSMIKRLGHVTIDRMDLAKSKQDTETLKATIKAGQDILLFPEGTFTYSAGIRPFKLGAFQLATEMGCSLSPIALEGTRTVLRWRDLPRPGTVKVTFLQPLIPKGKAWEEANRLRQIARLSIAKHSGEYLLDLANVRIPLDGTS